MKIVKLSNGIWFVARDPKTSRYRKTLREDKATQFSEKEATDLLRSKKPQYNWLKVDGYQAIPVVSSGKSAYVKSKNSIYIGLHMEENCEIGVEVDKIKSCQLWDIHTLELKENELSEAQSYYDSALSDVLHLLEVHNPPAHTRAKIYKILQDLRIGHTRTNKNLKYVRIMKRGIEEKWTFQKLQSEINGAEYKDYKGRTDYFNKVLELL